MIGNYFFGQTGGFARLLWKFCDIRQKFEPFTYVIVTLVLPSDYRERWCIQRTFSNIYFQVLNRNRFWTNASSLRDYSRFGKQPCADFVLWNIYKYVWCLINRWDQRNSPHRAAMDSRKNDCSGSDNLSEQNESLPSLRSMASSRSVANYFTETQSTAPKQIHQSSDSFEDTGDAVQSKHSHRTSNSRHTSEGKRKNKCRQCPHCTKNFPDFSAVSQHLQVCRTSNIC